MIRHRLAGAGLAFAATLTPSSPVALVNELIPTDDQLDHHRSLVGAPGRSAARPGAGA